MINTAVRQRRKKAVAVTKVLKVVRRAKEKVARATKVVVEKKERSRKVTVRKAFKEVKNTLTIAKRVEKEANKELVLKIARNKVESQALRA